MRKQLMILLSIFISIGSTHVAMAIESKYLCISEVSGGLKYSGGAWRGTNFKADSKYLMVMEGGVLKSVNVFGASDDLSMTYCSSLKPTMSFVCTDNFDMFRFQPSTKRFVMSKTSGYTSEFEEGGINLSANSFTPNITIGKCEAI